MHENSLSIIPSIDKVFVHSGIQMGPEICGIEKTAPALLLKQEHWQFCNSFSHQKRTFMRDHHHLLLICELDLKPRYHCYFETNSKTHPNFKLREKKRNLDALLKAFLPLDQSFYCIESNEILNLLRKHPELRAHIFSPV